MSRGSNLRKTYWASTWLIAIAMVGAGIQELRHAPELLEPLRRLGYPEYLLTILGTAKLVGAPLLLWKGLPRLKEWVYAGYSFDFGGAIVSHAVVGDTLLQTLPALVCAAVLTVSYLCHRALGSRSGARGGG